MNGPMLWLMQRYTGEFERREMDAQLAEIRRLPETTDCPEEEQT